MKAYIFIIMIFLFLSPAFAEDSEQQGNVLSKEQEQLTRGFDYIKSGKYEAAVIVFQKIKTLNPTNPDAYAGLALSYWNIGDNKSATVPDLVRKAIEAGRKALDLRVDYPEVHAILGFVTLPLMIEILL
jgi:Flp pilus assembly protein TadD